jgi:3-hydroxybutyryl-CoA dehydrogenase
MPIEELQLICFVGAGNMGCFNAVKAALSGYRVTLHDVSRENLNQALARCEGIANYLAGSGYCPAERVPDALARMSPHADLAAATAEADLVSESVFERLGIKREVHRDLDRVCPQRTILTTNSSFLLPSAIEDAVQRGDRFAAMHSYMGSPLVDIVGGGRTSEATIDLLERYVKSINAVPLILKKEYPGYVLNALLGPVLATAMLLVAEGEGSNEDVDRAWMQRRSAPMGPFGILDLIGINLVHSGWENRDDEGGIPGLRPKVLSLLGPLVERNELGMSTGKGFYAYPEPDYQDAGFLAAGGNPDRLYQPLEIALVASAIQVAAAGVAEPAEIDMAWKVGTSLDKGPFTILDELGTDLFVDKFKQHVAAGRFDQANSQTVLHYCSKLVQRR